MEEEIIGISLDINLILPISICKDVKGLRLKWRSLFCFCQLFFESGFAHKACDYAKDYGGGDAC